MLVHDKLHLKMDKCESHKQEVNYPGMIVERDRIKMCSDKVAVVKDWELSECTFDVQSCLSFANFHLVVYYELFQYSMVINRAKEQGSHI